MAVRRQFSRSFIAFTFVGLYNDSKKDEKAGFLKWKPALSL
jgi:hypothetical protein